MNAAEPPDVDGIGGCIFVELGAPAARKNVASVTPPWREELFYIRASVRLTSIKLRALLNVTLNARALLINWTKYVWHQEQRLPRQSVWGLVRRPRAIKMRMG